jgi:3,2-trans-enoyl-CoA isomerase
VNALSTELLSALKETLAPLHGDKPPVKSLLLVSSRPTVFSAGLDLKALLQSSEGQETTRQAFAQSKLRPFLGLFQEVVASLLALDMPTGTVVSGSCPAGGTVLALCTDYRVLSTESPRTLMGLTEVAVGMAPPLWVHKLGATAIPPTRLFRMLELGQALTDPKDILSAGLVHDLAETPSKAFEMALKELQQVYEVLPNEARVSAKRQGRLPVLEAITEDSLDAVVDSVSGKEFQDKGESILAMLKGSSKKKSSK